MYQIIKNVIKRGDYDLSGIIRKINTLWVDGCLTDDQKEELLTLARSDAQPGGSVDLIARLNDLESRVRALETKDPVSSEDFPEFVTGKWYYNGDKCSFNGKNYICTAPEGTPCVWSPSDYPNYWEEQEGA